MRSFDRYSFALGIGAGLLATVLIGGGMRLAHRRPSQRMDRGDRGALQQRAGGQRMPGDRGGMDDIAKRLGMTPEAFRQALREGKTPRDLAEERGIDLAAPAAEASASAQPVTGTGGMSSAASSQ